MNGYFAPNRAIFIELSSTIQGLSAIDEPHDSRMTLAASLTITLAAMLASAAEDASLADSQSASLSEVSIAADLGAMQQSRPVKPARQACCLNDVGNRGRQPSITASCRFDDDGSRSCVGTRCVIEGQTRLSDDVPDRFAPMSDRQGSAASVG
jgi:hypothetical protein